MDVLLPQTAIDILPFSAEPLSSLKGKTDIRRFIDALYAEIYPPFSADLYKREKKYVLDWSRRFSTGAREPLHNKDLKEQIQEEIASSAVSIPLFSEDIHFGRAAKYVVAWNCCIQTLLEEAGFYSLAHLLESKGEIESSLLLASNLYYKQAVQILRNFIEELIMPIHFCDNVHDFEQWKANHYRTPPLRGRDGLIIKLTDKGILPAAIAKEVADLYGDLNSFVHGSENRLNHKNIHSSPASGLMFRYDDFCSWAQYLSRSIDVGVRLVKINYLQWNAIRSAKWQALRQDGKIICSSCHNETDFDTMVMDTKNFKIQTHLPDGTWADVDESFPGYLQYTCRRCGHITVIRADKQNSIPSCP